MPYMEQPAEGPYARWLEVRFIDHGREPTQKPDPRFPNGVGVDGTDGAQKSCLVELPYPAPRCGVMRVDCTVCGFSIGLTVAGRHDDPKTVRVPCGSPLSRR